MAYETTIHFTLDTICPWTYIAKKRLDAAREQLRSTYPDVTFKLHINPYQLFADAPATGEDKYEWYRRTKYNNSDEQMRKYTTVMGALGAGAGIDFKFGGQIAGTLDAHRVVQWVQDERGEAAAEVVVMSLYKQYFEQERHPSSRETLLAATAAAGVPDAEAARVVDDETEFAAETKLRIREQAGNGVDAVPFVVVEGRRRDLSLEGAKEVAEYVKALETVVKESR